MSTRDRARTDLGEGPRWSSAVECPRRAFYDAIRAPQDQMSDAVWNLRWRGKIIGEAVASSVVANWRAEGRRPQTEVPVPWPARKPIGTGHMDVYLPHLTRAVEIKTAQHCTLTASACLQVAGYAINHPRAHEAAVVVVDPLTGAEAEYPVDVAGLAEQVHEIEDTVVAALDAHSPSARVCRHPHDGPAMFCPFVTVCFADWDRDAEERVVPDFGGYFRRLEEVERMMRFNSSDLASLRAERDLIRDELRAHLEAGRDYAGGGVRVRRVEVAGSESISLAALRAAGHRLPPEIEAFIKRSDGHERWYVQSA